MKIKLDKNDILFSRYIRLRALMRVGGCEYCEKPKPFGKLQCSHFKGRGKHSTRFDPDNCAGICFNCHIYLGANPDIHTAWFQKRLGSERYDALARRANTPFKYGKVAKKEIELYLNKLLEGMNV